MYERDKEMIASPERWPIWPLLCMVRRDRFQAGALLADQDNKVYLWNRFAGQKLKDTEHIQYDSVEAMLADGWRVD